MGFLKNLLGMENEARSTDALRAIPARDRLAFPEWAAALRQHGVLPEADQWRIRDPEEAIRGWFMRHGSVTENGLP